MWLQILPEKGKSSDFLIFRTKGYRTMKEPAKKLSKKEKKKKKRESVKLSLRDNGKVGGLLLKSKLGFMSENSQRESWNGVKEGEKQRFIQNN